MRAGTLFAFPIFAIILIRIIYPDSDRQVKDSNYKDLPELQDSTVKSNTRYLYVGAEKCASVCHNNDTMGYQYNLWNGSPHRNAFTVLASEKAKKYAREAHLQENPQVSQVCLKCHITGAGLDSTYFASTYKKEDGVTCEACHKHSYNSKTYLPDESDCLVCHNNSLHQVHKFSFKMENEKIAHKRPVKTIPGKNSSQSI